MRDRDLVSRSKSRPFALKGAEEPNYYEEDFPYIDIPLFKFDEREVPMNLPKRIWITDTTFRDGQQSRPPYTVHQIEALFEMLHRLSGPNGVVRQSEFFLYSEKDRRALEACLEKGYRYPEITGWMRASRKDLSRVKEMGLKETGMLSSCSDYHIHLKLGMTRREAMERYLGVAKAALDIGIRPRCHMEDITRADIYGFVVPFAQEVMRLSEESGEPIIMRLCDTLGLGLPYPQASLPRGIPKLIQVMMKDAGVPSEQLEWHGHNDFHRGEVNAVTAWLYGASSANGSLLGIGERTGNSVLEGLIIDYIAITGHTDGIDTRVITEIAEYYRDEVGYEVPPNYPLVGAEFNVTRAGIHIDGLIKDERIYNPFDTEKVLNRPIKIQIFDKSGLAGVFRWIMENYPSLRGRMDKNHRACQAIYERISVQYENGRITAIAPEEMHELCQELIPELNSYHQRSSLGADTG